MIVTWSKRKAYKTCPWQFFLVYGSKELEGKARIPFQDNKYTIAGRRKHALLEQAVKGLKAVGSIPGNVVSAELWSTWWAPMLESFVREYKDVIVEERIGVDSSWESHILGDYYKPLFPTTEPVILHGCMDLVLFDDARGISKKAVILDWKSGRAGKDIGQGIGQLAVYSLMALLTWPNLEEVSSIYVYIDQRSKCSQKWLRKDVHRLKTEVMSWKDEIDASMKLRVFKKTQGPACNWCAAAMEDCEYGHGSDRRYS